MPPKKPGLSELELFRMLLTNMINMSHPLVKVANEIDWTRFDAAWPDLNSAGGTDAERCWLSY
jgi:hypothetical protein